MLCEVENVWARSENTASSCPLFYSWKCPPASYKPMQNTELLFCFVFNKGNNQVSKVLFTLCLGDQKGLCCWDRADVVFIVEDPLLASQCSWGTKDWSLQLIFLIGCLEEMGPDSPRKCLLFYVAFTALSILTVFCCYFTVCLKSLMWL